MKIKGNGKDNRLNGTDKADTILGGVADELAKSGLTLLPSISNLTECLAPPRRSLAALPLPVRFAFPQPSYLCHLLQRILLAQAGAHGCGDLLRKRSATGGRESGFLNVPIQQQYH